MQELTRDEAIMGIVEALVNNMTIDNNALACKKTNEEIEE